MAKKPFLSALRHEELRPRPLFADGPKIVHRIYFADNQRLISGNNPLNHILPQDYRVAIQSWQNALNENTGTLNFG